MPNNSPESLNTHPTSSAHAAKYQKTSELSARSSTTQCDIAVVFFLLVAGLCGILTALLPVNEVHKEFSWPQSTTVHSETASVSAPLSTMTPESLSIDIPVKTLLQYQSASFLSTIPADSSMSSSFGLTISTYSDHVRVSSRDTSILSVSAQQLNNHPRSRLHIDTSNGSVQAYISGTPITSAQWAAQHQQTHGPELKPQVSGLFTSLSNAQLTGVHAHVTVDNRFDIFPSTFKSISIWGGLIALVAAALCSYLSYRRHRFPTAVQRTRIRLKSRIHQYITAPSSVIDVLVALALTLWWIVGPGGIADGVYASQAINSIDHHSPIEYYRFFSVGLAPYHWYPHLIGLLSTITPNPFLLRALLALVGIITWLIIHHKALPIIGQGATHSFHFLSIYIGAGLFTCMWMTLDNSLHPEPIIAFLILVSWISLHSYLRTTHPLTAVCGFTCIGLSVITSAVGIIALSVLLVYAKDLLKLWSKHTKGCSVWSTIATYSPPLIAFTLIWIIEFSTQTPATIAEAIRVKINIGPIISWSQEYLRYYFLAHGTDTSLSIRIAVLLGFFCVFISFFLLSQGRKRPSINVFQAKRVLSILFISAVLIIITPNKWLIEFGSLTSLIGVIAVITSELLIAPSTRYLRNSLIFLTSFIFILSWSSATKNSWPVLAKLSIPWYNMKPVLMGSPIATLGLYLTVIMVFLTLLAHYHTSLAPQRYRTENSTFTTKAIIIPLALVLTLLIAFNMSIFAKAWYSRSHTYSVTGSNLAKFTGTTCGLGNYIEVEPHPSNDLLTPLNHLNHTQALQGNDPRNVGFTPNGIPHTIIDKAKLVGKGHTYTAIKGQASYLSVGQYPGTNGGSAPSGVNGSTAKLPFTLDRNKVPVLGSYGYPSTARLTTGWYQLPQFHSQHPFLAVAVAGAVLSRDQHGSLYYGQSALLEFAHIAQGKVTSLATVTPIDAALGNAWRDLRVDLHPFTTANAVRLILTDASVRDDQWIAITPPRLPHLTTIHSFLSHQNRKVFKDLAIAPYFPCLRSVNNQGGVWEEPHWRITPERHEMNTSSFSWQKASDGGPLGIIEALYQQNIIPTFMKGDLYQDWGSLVQLTPYQPAIPARITSTIRSQSSLHRAGPIRAFGGNDESKH